MTTLSLWLYTLIGICISLRFMERHSMDTKNDSSVPMLILVGALIIYLWPIYLIYYFYSVEEQQ